MDKFYEDEEIRDATRLHNRALRTVNRALRRQAERAKQQTDEVVAALFDAPVPEDNATLAFDRLQASGLFVGLQDYESIVEQIISSVNFSNAILAKVRNKVQSETAQGSMSGPVAIEFEVKTVPQGTGFYSTAKLKD